MNSHKTIVGKLDVSSKAAEPYTDHLLPTFAHSVNQSPIHLQLNVAHIVVSTYKVLGPPPTFNCFMKYFIRDRLQREPSKQIHCAQYNQVDDQ